jgi:hypothetical protein
VGRAESKTKVSEEVATPGGVGVKKEFAKKVDDALNDLVEQLPAWLAEELPFAWTAPVTLWLTKRLGHVATVFLWFSVVVSIPAFFFIVLEKVTNVGILSLEQKIRPFWTVAVCLLAAAALLAAGIFVMFRARNGARRRSWPSIVLFWLASLILVLVTRFDVGKFAAWTFLVAALCGLIGFATLAFVEAVRVSREKLEDARRRKSESDEFARQHLVNMSRTFDELGKTTVVLQRLNSALTDYPELKPKVFKVLANWASQWAQLIQTLQERNTGNEQLNKAEALAVSQVLEVYVQEEMLDVKKCMLATNLEFYTKLLESLLDPDWSPVQGETAKGYSFIRLLLGATAPPAGYAEAVLEVRTLTPILPQHWWNWAEIGQDEDVDIYRESVKRLAAHGRREFVLPRGDKIKLTIEWHRTVLVQAQAEANSSDLFATPLCSVGLLAEQLRTWKIVKHGTAQQKKMPLIGQLGHNKQVLFDSGNISRDTKSALANHLPPNSVPGSKAYIIFDSQLDRDLKNLLSGDPCFECDSLGQWYLHLHSEESLASYGAVDDNPASIKSAWDPCFTTPQSPPRIPTEFSIFGLKWLDAQRNELSRTDFLGVVAPGWNPKHRTMLLQLWLPHDEKQPLEALEAVWKAIPHTAISSLRDSVPASRAEAEQK